MASLTSKSKYYFVRMKHYSNTLAHLFSFLQLVLPMNNIALRAKVSQRQNYQVGGNDRLQTNVEFELSRLFEKEIHYHVKIEIEKKALEAMEEFNTVSVFSVID